MFAAIDLKDGKSMRIVPSVHRYLKTCESILQLNLELPMDSDIYCLVSKFNAGKTAILAVSHWVETRQI